jgi:protein transport protein SEC61 subunit gamma-like protein
MSPLSLLSWGDVLSSVARNFARDSVRLLRRCTKPDKAEFLSVAKRVGLSALGAGFVGFFVKLAFIPARALLL